MKLTQEQQRALESHKNVLVEAGAGTGKTALFVQRYLAVLKRLDKPNPKRILAITYTKKAAAECKSRIFEALEKDPDLQLNTIEDATINTIHGFCSSLLRQYCFEANISPTFSVLSDDDALFLFESALQQSVQRLSAEKNAALTALLLHHSENQIKKILIHCFHKRQYSLNKQIKKENNLSTDLLTVFKQVYKQYKLEKSRSDALDYQELLDSCAELLLTPSISEELSKHYAYIMVDECQDTDPKQWAIIRCLCTAFKTLEDKKLFLVGDSKQSIYSFRGAELKQFEAIKSDFLTNSNDCDVVPLTINFRSAQQLLSQLNPIFKPLFETSADSPIRYHALQAFKKEEDGLLEAMFLKDGNSDADEAKAISLRIKQLLNDGYKHKDIAIISRRSNHCEFLRQALQKEGLPIKLDKQKGFFQQQLVIDCFQLIKGILNPNDSMAWFSILQSPFFNRSASHCYFLHQAHSELGFYDSLEQLSKENSQENPFYADVLSDFSIIKTWVRFSRYQLLSDVIRHILYSDQSQAYKQSYSEFDNQSALLLSLIRELEQDSSITRQRLIEKLEFKLSIYDNSFEKSHTEANAITISTIHSMKGLEFPVVFVAACHKDFYVNKSDSCILDKERIHLSDNSEQSKAFREQYFDTQLTQIVEEEKRLFYVACTRAKNRCILSGLWHEKSKHSTLNFLKSLKQFQDDDYSLTFNSDGKQIQIPCCYQLSVLHERSENTKEKVTVIDTEKDESRLYISSQAAPITTAESAKHLSVSAWIKQGQSPSPTLTEPSSLSYFEYSIIGELTHIAIQLFLSGQSEADALKNAIKKQWPYQQLSSKQKQALNQHISRIANSTLLNRYRKKAYTAEYPFTVVIDKHLISGRLDAIAIDSPNKQADILEFKSDFCLSSKALLDQYEAQLNSYARCIFAYLEQVDTIHIHLYSSHLDQEITKKYLRGSIKTSA